MFGGSEMAINSDNWVPACGGTEVPFETRTGRTLLYMWNTTTGEHAYYDMRNDVFLSNDELPEVFGY
jgi:hypothetical protein